MKNYRLYLVRHGVTQGNLDGIYMGSGTDQPLCAQGAAQLRALAARFPYPKAETVFSSPMRRAVETVELLFPDGSKIVVNTQPPLHELWLAARGGGFHFRHVGGRWLDTRDGGEFAELLSRHASEHAGRALRFDLG